MRESLSKLQQLVVDATTEKKASNIILLDLRNRTDLTDYFLICSGNSKVQVQAIADNIHLKTSGTPYEVTAQEGYQQGNWVILDLGDMIVHIFLQEVRTHFDLERLWGDVPVIAAMSD